jgi:erythromycin esterase-like protein
MHATLAEWIGRDAVTFSPDSPDTFDRAVETVLSSLSDSVELLGFGEALHGAEDILLLRNRLFQRLVTAHGYAAIAIESSFPAGRLVNEYIGGGNGGGANAPASYEDVKERGFSHDFGRVEANRELVEWMRSYNTDPSHRSKLRFFGFDIPGLHGYASPRQTLHFALDYLASIERASAQTHRQRIDAVLGQDAEWENPAVYMDPSKAVGLSPAAAALRIATEDLITELRTRRPECVARSSRDAYAEALQHALIARELLNSHAGLAAKAGYAALLGIRDALMADTLAHIVDRERDRSPGEKAKVFVFAHNGHLQRGKIAFPVLGEWWPAGSHLKETLGRRYAVIGSAVVASEPNGIGEPEPGSFEAMLAASAGPVRFIPTYNGAGLPVGEIASLATRSGSKRNPTYQPLRPQSLTDFDWLAVLDSTSYTRGGRPLPI